MKLNFEYHGPFADSGAPLLVLSHGLGNDLHVWDAVLPLLPSAMAVLRYDHRGHGDSERACERFGIDDLARDALQLIEQHVPGLGRRTLIFAGLSMGGMTGQALAANNPSWLSALVIANSAQCYDDLSRAMWNQRIRAVTENGMASIVDGAMQRWFTSDFRVGGYAAYGAARETLARCDPVSYAHACAAVRDIDLAEGNATIRCRTLVLAGRTDVATPPAMSEALARRIPGAHLQQIDAPHMSPVENPKVVAKALTAFAG